MNAALRLRDPAMNKNLYSLLILGCFATEIILGLSIPVVATPTSNVAAMGVLAPVILALLQLRGDGDD